MSTPQQAVQKVDRVESVKNLGLILEQNKGKLTEVASKHLNVDRLLRLLLAAAGRNPKILQCSQSSVLQFVMKCAETGLEPIGAGGAWPVPFENRKNNTVELQFIPDYRGLVNKAKQAGCIVDAWAEIVREKDVFDYTLGLDPTLTHKPARADRGELEAAYCIMKMPDGSSRFIVMDRVEVLAIKKRSKAADYGPWVSDESEMWKKTITRRAMKPFAGVSPEIDAALEADADADSITITTDPIQMPKALPTAAAKTLPENTAKGDGQPSEPEPATGEGAPAQPANEQPALTMRQKLAQALQDAGVTLEDAADFMETNRLIPDAAAVKSINDLPEETCTRLATDTKLMAKLIKTFGAKAS